MLRHRLKPLHIAVAVVLVVAVAATVGWRLTFGKRPEPMKELPWRMKGAPGIEAVVPSQSESEDPAASTQIRQDE